MSSTYSDEDVDSDQEVVSIRRNTVHKSTRRSYLNSICKFLTWVFDYQGCGLEVEETTQNPYLLEENFVILTFEGSSLNKKAVLAFLDQPEELDPPIKFENLTPELFLKWLLTLKRPDGAPVGASSLGNHRAGLRYLFRLYNRQVPKEFEQTVQSDFIGLIRRLTTEVASGNGNIKKGKDPLLFTLYQKLATVYMSRSNPEYIFAHTFLLLCWNLMCRAGNVVSIRVGHMEWKEDALGIYFAHMKNDQLGERPRDPRHIYANPYRPEVCPILSLGIYMLCLGIGCDNERLFPGGAQYDRYRRIMSNLLDEDNEQNEELYQHAFPYDIGTHSMRKGAATFASSGSTACPSSAAIHLRAGWSMGGVQNTYLR